MNLTVDMTKNAMGGTELMGHRVLSILESCEEGRAFLERYEILVSRIDTELNPDKKYIYWIHDLAEDPQVGQHLQNNGWERFHRLVFVSSWQRDMFVRRYGIPFYKCSVIHNFVQDCQLDTNKWNEPEKIKFIYHSTPHRGLNILVPVFIELCKEFDNIELDVYSSFELYGWKERDEPYKKLFDMCKEHEQINYHGTVSNEEVQKALKSAHVFAYPNTWQETFCLCMVESVLNGVVCIHPNYAALPEISAGQTLQYQYTDLQEEHANVLYNILYDFVTAYSCEDSRTIINTKSIMSAANLSKLYTQHGVLQKWLALDTE